LLAAWGRGSNSSRLELLALDEAEIPRKRFLAEILPKRFGDAVPARLGRNGAEEEYNSRSREAVA
jgi:hypothetical protein